MSNPAYQRGRKLEWEVAKAFRRGGFRTVRAAGSHGLADVVVMRDGDFDALMQPIPFTTIAAHLPSFQEIRDTRQVLDPFLYGFESVTKTSRHLVYAVPAQVWLLQMKTHRR